MRRDEFGLHRIVYDVDGHTAASVQALLQQVPDLRRDVDVEALRLQIARTPDLTRTFLRAVREVPPGQSQFASPPPSPLPVERGVGGERSTAKVPLEGLLSSSVARVMASGKQVGVALSGGLDSAMVLAWARAHGDVTAYVLNPQLESYSELAGAQHTAKALGAKLRVVDVDEADFLRVLPLAIKTIEVPIYNAHPVAKLLLAQAMRDDGVDVALTGDGADHVMNRDRQANYLPLVQALFDVAGVGLRSPFLDDDVVARLLTLPPDRDKRVLREIADRLHVPAPLVTGPKLSRLAPPIDVESIVTRAQIERVEALLEREASMPTDADKMLWSTTALLLQQFDLL
ncbi:MAG: asparagine synthase C-terminal domain-containing protein [Deltaproteobacteria bacterium]|nr:asparagine synthase C-terminal domain-containing protein [Deltaproteobacteria bacterium]